MSQHADTRSSQIAGRTHRENMLEAVNGSTVYPVAVDVMENWIYPQLEAAARASRSTHEQIRLRAIKGLILKPDFEFICELFAVS